MSSEKNVQRVFVKVVGFTDVERHALNTVFRLSERRNTVYSLWVVDAPERPRLALIDGQSYEARLELASAHDPELKLIWVGVVAPANARRTFERPLFWPDVLDAMDGLFAAPPEVEFDLDLDLELDGDEADTRPPAPLVEGKRALIASADRDQRLYLRAKLALAELTQADEAETGAQALELARRHQYAVALVDFGLPDVSGWALLKQLTEARPAIPHLIMIKAQASAGERVRAWFAGANGCFDKPAHPGKLRDLLQKV